MTLVIIFIVLFIFCLFSHMILLFCGTNIGKKGRKNMMMQSVFGITEALFIFVISIIVFIKFEPTNMFYLLAFVLVGIILLLVGIINIRGLLRETPDDIVTETLSDVHIVPTGYHNMARKLEGKVNGSSSFFILRGPDKVIAQRIKENDLKQVTIVYHSSNRRIESIPTFSQD